MSPVHDGGAAAVVAPDALDAAARVLGVTEAADAVELGAPAELVRTALGDAAGACVPEPAVLLVQAAAAAQTSSPRT